MEMKEKSFSRKEREMHDEMIRLTSQWKTECELQGFYYEVGFCKKPKKVIINDKTYR
ncbi:MAG: hypothetical protein AABY22_08700 [Nanoarchaeota archaeon]